MSTIVLSNKSTNVRTNFGWRIRLRLALLRVLSWIPTRGAVSKAVELFTTPLPGTRDRALRADLSGATQVSIRNGSLTLTAYVYGDPSREPYVLLSHGWSSYGLRFHAWVGHLREAGYAVVCFDHQAHGRSGGKRASLPEFVRGAMAVGQHFGPAAAGIGHSLGGAALAHAVARGLSVERLLLLAPAAEGEAAIERFVRTLKLGAAMPARMQAQFAARSGEPMRDYHAERAAAGLRIPVLVVHDLQDAEVPWSEGERYALRTPGARLLTVSGLGHHRVVDAPEVLDAGLRFLRGEQPGERLGAAGSLTRHRW